MAERKKRKYKTDEERWGNYERDTILRCPFCKTPLAGPEALDTPFGDTIDAGRCECGSVYVYDRSGRMLGEAFTEALALAYDWDYDKAYEGADGGYEEAVVRYDGRFNKYFLDDGGRFDRNPKYFFVKRKKGE